MLLSSVDRLHGAHLRYFAIPAFGSFPIGNDGSYNSFIVPTPDEADNVLDVVRVGVRGTFFISTPMHAAM